MEDTCIRVMLQVSLTMYRNKVYKVMPIINNLLIIR